MFASTWRMLGTVVLLHHDIAVVVDPDVLMRRAVQQSLADLGLQALAYGAWHDAVRQLARVAPKLRSLSLPSDQADWDAIELCSACSRSSVPPVVGFRCCRWSGFLAGKLMLVQGSILLSCWPANCGTVFTSVAREQSCLCKRSNPSVLLREGCSS